MKWGLCGRCFYDCGFLMIMCWLLCVIMCIGMFFLISVLYWLGGMIVSVWVFCF